jgi:hypothetical protein
MSDPGDSLCGRAMETRNCRQPDVHDGIDTLLGGNETELPATPTHVGMGPVPMKLGIYVAVISRNLTHGARHAPKGPKQQEQKYRGDPYFRCRERPALDQGVEVKKAGNGKEGYYEPPDQDRPQVALCLRWGRSLSGIRSACAVIE